jgi:2-hydroxychromene-2-carboxylate isomerase
MASREVEMARSCPVLYFDLGSPYAYLALERARTVLGTPPDLQPILLGAIFAKRGFGSWAQTSARDARTSEVESRASRYSLPPLCWPSVWPANGLRAMRSATWAEQQNAGDAFARAAFRKEFVEGRDIAELALLLECAEEAGLDADETARAIDSSEIKQALRDATEAAWQVGVRGVPSMGVGDAIFYGDDQLELAAAMLLDA